MMQTIKVKNTTDLEGEKGDWILGSVVNKYEAVIQNIEGSISLWLKDAFWDEGNGINYREFIGISQDDLSKIELLQNLVILQIIKVQGVKSIKSTETAIDNNKLTITSLVYILDNTEPVKISSEIQI